MRTAGDLAYSELPVRFTQRPHPVLIALGGDTLNICFENRSGISGNVIQRNKKT